MHDSLQQSCPTGKPETACSPWLLNLWPPNSHPVAIPLIPLAASTARVSSFPFFLHLPFLPSPKKVDQGGATHNSLGVPSWHRAGGEHAAKELGVKLGWQCIAVGHLCSMGLRRPLAHAGEADVACNPRPFRNCPACPMLTKRWSCQVLFAGLCENSCQTWPGS